MCDLWVKSFGEWTEDDVKTEGDDKTEVENYLEKGLTKGKSYILALYANRFVCASVQKLQEMKKLDDLLKDVKWLLEMRVFDEDQELWAHRTMLGQPFSWRVASDATLKEKAEQQTDDFLKKPENHRLEQKQLLDIDKKHPSDKEPIYGGKSLRSTGRGEYELPIEEGQDAVTLVSYIRYDEIGMAHVVDYRLKGFGTLVEAKEHKGGEKQ